MPLQTSGAISLNDMHIEAGGSSGTQASLNDADIRDMIGKASGATASFNEYYGASSTNAISSYTLDHTKHTSNGQSYMPFIGRFTTISQTFALPSDKSGHEVYWPVSDKAFDTVSDSLMPVDTSYRSNMLMGAYLNSDGAYSNVNVSGSGFGGTISTGGVNGAHFTMNRSYLIPFNKITTGSHTFSCTAYAGYYGDVNLGTFRGSQIQIYVREFDGPTALNSDYVYLANKGTRTHIGGASNVLSNNAISLSKTWTTTKEYLCIEVWVSTNAYSGVSVGFGNASIS